VIALCALFYTIQQSKNAQNHNKLSFRPHLTTWTHQNSENGRYRLELINNGLGPALIECFTIKIDGRIISGEGTEPIEKGLKLLFPDIKYASSQAYLGKSYAMAAKEKRTILDINFLEKVTPKKEIIEHTFNRATLIIKYKSVYEEDFTFSSEDTKTNT
jgi:hypothetical protein